ncbi:hypothetical protein V8C42DRAFT_325744 [Trichoderma barbatum]
MRRYSSFWSHLSRRFYQPLVLLLSQPTSATFHTDGNISQALLEALREIFGFSTISEIFYPSQPSLKCYDAIIHQISSSLDLIVNSPWQTFFFS